MKRLMGENTDTKSVKVNLNIQVKKSFITNIDRIFWRFVSIYKRITVKENTMYTHHKQHLLKKWKNTLRNTEMASVKKKG